MTDLFLTVLSMSVATSWVILVVLFLRLILCRAPKIFSYTLWGVVLFRLLCPLSIHTALSPLPPSPALSAQDIQSAALFVTTPQTPAASVEADTSRDSLQAPAASHPPSTSTAAAPLPLLRWVELASRVWLAGYAVLLLVSALSLLLLRRRLVGSIPLEGEPGVRLADHIPSPFVLGLLRPTVYLPSGLPREERTFVLLHERTHIRRLDHLFRALAWLAVALHWFNPLVWLAFHLAGRDMEMSCDEAVLRRLGPEVRADYSSSLLRLSSAGRLPAGPLAFGDGDPKSRIKNILRYQRPALWVTLAALVVVAISVGVLATSRDNNAPDSQPADLTNAQDSSYTLQPASAPDLELRPAYALDELGAAVVLSGLDCDAAWWYPKALSAAYETPAQALGYLDLWEPRCLGETFSQHYSGCTAQYSPEEAPDLLWLTFSGSGSPVVCTVELVTGAVTNLEIPDVQTASTSLSQEEMLSIARALAELIQQASDYYIAATDLPKEEGPLPFDRAMKLWFGSGAGAWRTILTLHPDGSFEGDYSDADMDTQYVCQFHGRFGEITQVSDASWSMALQELELDTGYPLGESWTEDGIRYISSTPYGIYGGDGQTLALGAQFLFYTPQATGDAPGTELYGQDDFWSWWPARFPLDSPDDTLGCYGLHNVEFGYGFFDLYAWGIL